MNKIILTLVTLAFFSAPVFAESINEMCTTEAKDAGIEEAVELKAYVDECITQLNEIAAEEQKESHAREGDGAEGVAATE